jgi:chaperonin GroEL
VPGGGVALLRASELGQVDQAPRTTTRRPASRSCCKALEAPIRQIADNAGDDGSVVSARSWRTRTYAFGYNAQTGEYGDLVKKGIIDPTKVVRTAIQDAASVAALLITTEAMVAELPKKDARCPAMGGGGMGGMDF